MPSYAIHLAVAEEYLKKNRDVTENYDEFIKGVIYPDTVKNKQTTHYGKQSSQSNLLYFLQENSTDSSFNRGHFLHLLTDYLFYNQYIETWSKKIYQDYDILNETLIKNYHLNIPEEIKNAMLPPEDNTLTILTEPLINRFIKEVSEKNIDNVIKEVKDNPEKWTRMRPLKFI